MMVRSLMLAALLAAAAPQLASAHVTLQPREAAAGSYAQLTFTVPHGCDGQPTTGIRVTIPEGIVSAKPQMKPGWSVTTRKRTLAQPASLHGKPVTEVVDEVTWRGGSLPDDLFDTFGLVVKLPEGVSKQLYLPVAPECGGVTRNWANVPAADAGHHHHGRDALPAPVLKLTPAAHQH